MGIPGFLYLILVHFICGRGLLKLFKIELPIVASTCISLITGVVLLSFVPCILQLLHVPITLASVGIATALYAAGFAVPVFINFKKPVFNTVKWPQMYEWPFILAMLVLLLVSAWRCFYYPPTSRDALTGPELIAEYTVKEHTMINSAFSVDLSTTNNYFKSPYVTGLQIIYKLIVFHFGQLWLIVLSFSFTAWMYGALRSRIHPIIAGVLMLFLFGVLEMYAYTYMILYDYSNAIFFFLGFYFLMQYLSDSEKRVNNFLFSCMLFGLATFIRTETIILVGFLFPMLAYDFYKNKTDKKEIAKKTALYFVIPLVFYVLCINVFVKNFIPIPFDLNSNLNPNLSDVSAFTQRIQDMLSRLIFSQFGPGFYGDIVYLFVIVVIIDLVGIRKFNKEARMALYGILALFIGLAFIGYVLPLADLMNTTKRSLFKMMPMLVFYMANSCTMLWISERIRRWGDPQYKPAPKPAKVVSAPKPLPRPSVARQPAKPAPKRRK